MKIVDLEQGSAEWLHWRQTHITASDMPIIMGKSKWCTPRLLWKRKVGFADGAPMNPAMKRGLELEPEVRERINVHRNATYIPIVVESSEIPWAGASLDGWDESTQTVLEIKCPNRVDHQAAEQGRIPEHYYSQVQWQAFVTKAKKAVYASFRDGHIAYVECSVDETYVAHKLLPAAQEFYTCVRNLQEPAFEEGEHIQITDPAFEALSKEWIRANEELEGVKAAYDEQKKKANAIKEKLVDLTDDGNCYGFGVRLTRVEKEGTIDWVSRWEKACEEVPGLDSALPEDKFRKKNIVYWMATKQ